MSDYLRLESRSSRKQMLPYLPPEVIALILSRLPAKSAVKCTAVCKAWYALIKDPSFISAHLHQAAALQDDYLLLHGLCGRSLNLVYRLYRENDAFGEYKQIHPPVKLGGSSVFLICGMCNGLVCLAGFNSDSYNIILWNPCIQKHFIFPTPDLPFEGRYKSAIGFGYDSESDDYKVLLVMPPVVEEDLTEVWLFSLNRCSWTRLSEVCPKHSCYCLSEVVFVKGALHWHGYLNDGMFTHTMILAYDLCTEKFHVLNYPETLTNHEHKLCLTKYEESIAVVATGIFEVLNEERLELWVMKEYGEDSSWMKVLHSTGENGKFIFDSELFYVLGVRKNGELLLIVRGDFGHDFRLATLDLNCHTHNHQLKGLGLVGDIDIYASYFGSNVESLVLLGSGEEDTKVK
ncbi:unnamed protein product [Cuscuta campestris]|uniref:F-box domain-containing protein n=1 Tax=Cuscuta campestris TaxID=132261 RepID=A0A484L617_9ASTE|nr:unnamed protein product [Cuscuta campestris]